MRKSMLLMLLVACLTSSCGSLPRSKDKELEQVAKDWSMTIRASQVIPVFPLTEDLQPGTSSWSRSLSMSSRSYTRRKAFCHWIIW